MVRVRVEQERQYDRASYLLDKHHRGSTTGRPRRKARARQTAKESRLPSMSSSPRTRRTLARLLVAVTAFNYAVITSKGAEQASSSLGGGAIPGFPSAPGIAPPIEARHAILPGQKIQPEEISDLTSALKFGQFQPFRLQFDPVYYTGDRSFPYRHSLPYARTTTSSSTPSSGRSSAGTSGSTGAAEQIVVEEYTGTTTATGGSTPKRERVLPLIAPFLNETYLVAVYSVSYCAPEKSTRGSAAVEGWFEQNESPSRQNPLRMGSVFNAVGLLKDELGSSCIGYDFQAELCLQAIDLVTTADEGLPVIYIPAPVVAHYRVETLLLPTPKTDSDPEPYLKQQFPEVWQKAVGDKRMAGVMDTANRAEPFKTKDEAHAKILLQYMAAAAATPGVSSAEMLADEAAGTTTVSSGHQSGTTSHLGEPIDRLEFTLPNLDEAAGLWAGDRYNLTARESWMKMMSEALQYVVQAAEIGEKGLWAEFGVASGKSTAYIATLMQKTYGPGVTLHGFDSFIGIPEKWNNLEGGTFTMEGKVPELVTNMKNIQVHKGWFNETKYDLDHLDRVAFLHMDMDIYPAAREVLLHFACRLERGTVLVFDELINYEGWIYDGEFLALQEVTSLVGLVWEPLGFYHEQAVPIMIMENRRLGCRSGQGAAS